LPLDRKLNAQYTMPDSHSGLGGIIKEISNPEFDRILGVESIAMYRVRSTGNTCPLYPPVCATFEGTRGISSCALEENKSVVISAMDPGDIWMIRTEQMPYTERSM
jgi:hypothetical protein